MQDETYKPYFNKKLYSYALGAFPAFELLSARPDAVERVFRSPRFDGEDAERLAALCDRYDTPFITNEKAVDRMREKDSCTVAAVFSREYFSDGFDLDKNSGHIVLENPGDMGNLGTIIRTAAGFGLGDIALVGEKCADIIGSKTVRASMGAVFRVRFRHFESFSDYIRIYGENRDIYPFMLKGAVSLSELERDEKKPFSLVFGNEGAGLDDSYLSVGQSVIIRHSADIDSLNLSLAAGIGMYEFTKHSFRRM